MAEFILSAFADEGGKTLDEQLYALKSNDISCIEPRGIDGVNIADYTESMAKELRRRLDDAGIGVSAIGSPFGKIEITESFEPHFEGFKRCVENACILGTENIRMFSFFFTSGQSYSAYHDEVFERLNRMAEYSLSCGVWCCHENEKGIYGDTAERCLEILRTFSGKMRGVFDPANFLQCGEDVLPAYDLLEPYVHYLHIKDVVKETGHVVPAGKGDGQIAELLKRFDKKDGQRFLTLEPHLRVFDGLEGLEQAGGTAFKLKNDYSYATNADAFAAASCALHDILKSISAAGGSDT